MTDFLSAQPASGQARVLMLGDVHRQFEDVTRLIETEQPDLILQVGDLGYWPRKESRVLRDGTVLGGELDSLGVPLYFCDGNHEDHAALRSLESLEVFPNVFYQPRGTTISLPDGRLVLFAGGARSIDREYRVAGEDWFMSEVLTLEDLEPLPGERVDIVISHTAPISFDPLDLRHRDRDPGRMVLEWAMQRLRPSLWVFGHFHRAGTGQRIWEEDGWVMEWRALNMAVRPGWWAWLPEKGEVCD